MAILSAREVEVCKRLRAFREGTKISRSKFAITLGIGSERLASYESGRAPLRYEVYREVQRHFFINPLWLATGEGKALYQHTFDDLNTLPPINPRALFTEVYDGYLSKLPYYRAHSQRKEFSDIADYLNALADLKGDLKKACEDDPEFGRQFIASVNLMAETVLKNFKLSNRIEVAFTAKRKRGK